MKTPWTDRTLAGNGQKVKTNFERWFLNSKVYDAQGCPLVVFHGAPDIRFIRQEGVFMTHKERLNFLSQDEERAFFFSSSHSAALSYADDRRSFDYQNSVPGVIDVYLSLQNPKIIQGDGKSWRGTREQVQKAKEEGRDGIIIRDSLDNYNNFSGTKPCDVFVVFSPNQIKSASRNSGLFDPASSNLNDTVDIPTESNSHQPERMRS